jgi:endonuclease/exonuclease/phosphatase family metal-dependent hydrolase
VPRLAVFQRRLGGRIALVAKTRIYDRALVSYNLHLESKASDALRFRQLREVLDDAGRNAEESPITIGGDFNMDASLPEVAEAIHRAGLRDALGATNQPTAAVRSSFRHARPIDWIFVSNKLNRAGQVHDNIHASDHYPISTTFRIHDLSIG